MTANRGSQSSLPWGLFSTYTIKADRFSSFRDIASYNRPGSLALELGTRRTGCAKGTTTRSEDGSVMELLAVVFSTFWLLVFVVAFLFYQSPAHIPTIWNFLH